MAGTSRSLLFWSVLILFSLPLFHLCNFLALFLQLLQGSDCGGHCSDIGVESTLADPGSQIL
jgi:hypothetical protein